MDAIIAASEDSAAFLDALRPSSITASISTSTAGRGGPPLSARAACRGNMASARSAECGGRKGSDLFVEAMCRLLPKYPDFAAVVVGHVTVDNLPFVERLKQHRRRRARKDRIRFLGELPIEEVPLWYQRVLIYVFASRVEGFGLTMLEAMAAGDAVAATRAGAAETVITDGDDGVLAPIGEIEALVALEPLMRDPERAARMGARARARVAKDFSRDREVEEIVALYRRLWGE